MDDALSIPDERTGMSLAESLGERSLANQTRGLADRLDPTAAVLRRRHAEADRHVSIRPAPDTMVWLTELMSVKDGVSVWAALTRAADSARAMGDPRSRGQVMADALAARATQGADEVPAAPQVRVNLVVSDRVLFADAEDSAWLDGYVAIPAELAREIVHDSTGNAELRRIYQSPPPSRRVDSLARETQHRTDRSPHSNWAHLSVLASTRPASGETRARD